MTAIQDRVGMMASQRFDARHFTPRLRMTQAQTTTLLQQVAAGESQAFTEVIDAYGALVWSIARRYFGRSAEAEDAVQESFIAVWKSAERYDPQTAGESTFIAMIARRRMIDRLRKQGRRPSTQPLESSPDPTTASGGESKDRLADEEQAAAVLQAIDTLDPPQPEVIRRSVMEGLTHAEIAEAMQLPLGTVKTHIRRGLIKVRKTLGITTPAAAPSISGAKP